VPCFKAPVSKGGFTPIHPSLALVEEALATLPHFFDCPYAVLSPTLPLPSS